MNESIGDTRAVFLFKCFFVQLRVCFGLFGVFWVEGVGWGRGGSVSDSRSSAVTRFFFKDFFFQQSEISLISLGVV